MNTPRIELTLYVVTLKTWGKQRFNNQLKSKAWWMRFYDEYMNGEDIVIDPKYQPLKLGILNKDGNPDIPVMYYENIELENKFNAVLV
jgi:hypothetical protein